METSLVAGHRPGWIHLPRLCCPLFWQIKLWVWQFLLIFTYPSDVPTASVMPVSSLRVTEQTPSVRKLVVDSQRGAGVCSTVQNQKYWLSVVTFNRTCACSGNQYSSTLCWWFLFRLQRLHSKPPQVLWGSWAVPKEGKRFCCWSCNCQSNSASTSCKGSQNCPCGSWCGMLVSNRGLSNHIEHPHRISLPMLPFLFQLGPMSFVKHVSQPFYQSGSGGPKDTPFQSLKFLLSIRVLQFLVTKTAS